VTSGPLVANLNKYNPAIDKPIPVQMNKGANYKGNRINYKKFLSFVKHIIIP